MPKFLKYIDKVVFHNHMHCRVYGLEGLTLLIKSSYSTLNSKSKDIEPVRKGFRAIAKLYVPELKKIYLKLGA